MYICHRQSINLQHFVLKHTNCKTYLMEHEQKKEFALRFNKLFEQLKADGKIKNKSAMGELLGSYNHIIKEILDGRRTLTIEQIHKLSTHFGVNTNYLFGFSEQMFLAESSPTKGNITLVVQKAQAGYALQPDNNHFLQNQPSFSLPQMEGQLFAFEISGDSMLPHIADGDLLICEDIERGQPLKDNAVYVVVTDTVVAKRVQQIRDNQGLQKLRLLSDNSPLYQPYEVELNEVRKMFKVKRKISNQNIL